MNKYRIDFGPDHNPQSRIIEARIFAVNENGDLNFWGEFEIIAVFPKGFWSSVVLQKE